IHRKTNLLSKGMDCRVKPGNARSWVQIGRGLVISVPEAQSRRRSDVVALEKGVRQSAIEFRVHEADVDIPLRCKLPVYDAGDRVEGTSALRVLGARAGRRAGGGAKEGILGVMVIRGDHIELVGDG